MLGVTSTTYPTCTMDGCEQEIWLRPDERTVCAACEKRGGPPPPRAAGNHATETDEDRVRHYLQRMTPDERQRHLASIELYNTAMAQRWKAIADKLS